MRSLVLACSLLLLPAQAFALCRCACVLGQMRPICQETDLMMPICQGICPDEIRPLVVTRPLAGGRQQFDTVRPFDPAPGGLQERNPDLNLDARGNPLGTAGVQTGNDAFSGLSAVPGAVGGLPAGGAAAAAGAISR